MAYQKNSKIAKSCRSRYPTINLTATVLVAMALAFCGSLCLAQEMAQGHGPAPRLAEDPHTDSHIAEAIRQDSADHIRQTIEQLVGFNNRAAVVGLFLALIARGMSNAEIATHLVLGEATVKTHLLHIYAKLDVNDRAAAVARAFERGLLGSNRT